MYDYLGTYVVLIGNTGRNVKIYVCTGDVPSQSLATMKNVSPNSLCHAYIIMLRTQQGSLADNVERLAHHNARILASVQPFLAGHAFRHYLRNPLPATSSGRSPTGSNACRLPGTTDRVLIFEKEKKKKKKKKRAITQSSLDACECDNCSCST